MISGVGGVLLCKKGLVITRWISKQTVIRYVGTRCIGS